MATHECPLFGDGRANNTFSRISCESVASSIWLRLGTFGCRFHSSEKVAGAHEFLLAVLAGTAATACAASKTRAECDLANALLARFYAKLLIPRLGT
jgi:hypothetical protein